MGEQQQRFSVVRDPVHGDVHLTHEELRVLDTPAMQRLRGIRQLGSASLVYPGAVHTRFDHSIGTLHLTQRMIEAINLASSANPGECLGVGDSEARVIRMAALVHDVTHIPFGHNVEDQAGLFHRHDTPYRFEERLDGNGELGRALGGLRGDVLAILTGEERTGAGGPPPYWSQILADTIGSDLLDYLQRDAYFTGLRSAVDPRVLSYFKIERASGLLFIDLAKRGMLREDILSEVLRLLEARYHFSERVYFHHAKIAAGALVARAVELALMGGALREQDFHDATDHSLLDLLERSVERSEPGLRRRVRSLVDRFRRRALPKRACVFPRQANREVQDALVERYFSPRRHGERAAAEDRIGARVQAETGARVEILIVCPAARMQLKEARTHVRWPGEGLRPLSEFAERVPLLADLERSYRDLWKFYVFADTEDASLLARIAAIAQEEFPGARNVYRP